jgi:hypothetical protein
MAKKKKVFPPAPAPFTNTYYVYYDKDTKQLLSVTNEKTNIYSDYLEVDFDVYDRLVSGKEKFSDYLLGIVKWGDESALKLISVSAESYNFKNTLLDIITVSSSTTPELLIEWHGPKNEWNFFLSNSAKQRLAARNIKTKFLFFVILESDYDFLIRTIELDPEQLFTQICVGVGFESKLEKQLDKISIATGVMFESTNLRIVNE